MENLKLKYSEFLLTKKIILFQKYHILISAVDLMGNVLTTKPL